MTAVIFTTAY